MRFVQRPRAQPSERETRSCAQNSAIWADGNSSRRWWRQGCSRSCGGQRLPRNQPSASTDGRLSTSTQVLRELCKLALGWPSTSIEMSWSWACQIPLWLRSGWIETGGSIRRSPEAASYFFRPGRSVGDKPPLFNVMATLFWAEAQTELVAQAQERTLYFGGSARTAHQTRLSEAGVSSRQISAGTTVW